MKDCYQFVVIREVGNLHIVHVYRRKLQYIEREWR
jgi:hypothetical protein